MKKRIMPLEIFFSTIIIISIILIITVISLEIKIYSQKINKKSEASIIASNILENMKTRSYDDIEKYINEISYVGMTKKIENNIQYVTIYGSEFTEKFFGTEIPEDYVIEFQTENYNQELNVLKKVSINVKYSVNKKLETLDVSTIIERENINECNHPIISDEYFQEFGISDDDYEIIPIKFSEDKNSYVVTSSDDTEWFNYSVKRWAKVVIFSRDGDSLKDEFVQSDGTIKKVATYDNMNLDLENYIYVWIPNFSIKDDITYFRYGTSKKSIKMDFSYIDGKYLYLNKIGEEVKDISKECSFDGVYGVWRKLDDIQDPYYSNFNLTKYAPINIY